MGTEGGKTKLPHGQRTKKNHGERLTTQSFLPGHELRETTRLTQRVWNVVSEVELACTACSETPGQTSGSVIFFIFVLSLVSEL